MINKGESACVVCASTLPRGWHAIDGVLAALPRCLHAIDGVLAALPH